jgi:hypothetical protein
MPQFDGPYKIVDSFPETSVYTLDLPNSPDIFPSFHASELMPYHPNDAILFPHRELPMPGPVLAEDGIEEWTVDSIIDEWKRGRGYQYLVRWAGWDSSADRWLPRRLLEETAALDRWLEEKAAMEI